MLIDIHVHTTHTPGATLTLAESVTRAKQAGLDGICVTDVHSVSAIAEAREATRREGLAVLIGFEACTDVGHFLVFVPDPERLPAFASWLPPDADGRLAYPTLAKAVTARGGLIIAAHPFDRGAAGLTGDAQVRRHGVEAVEVLNASRPTLANEFAEELAAGMGLPGVGGSDARTTVETIGRFATLTRGTIRTEAELIESIRASDTWPVAIGASAFPSLDAPPRQRMEGRDGPRGDREQSRPPRREDRGHGSGGDRRNDRDRGPRQARERPPRASGQSGDDRQARQRPRSDKPRPPKPQ